MALNYGSPEGTYEMYFFGQKFPRVSFCIYINFREFLLNFREFLCAICKFPRVSFATEISASFFLNLHKFPRVFVKFPRVFVKFPRVFVIFPRGFV